MTTQQLEAMLRSVFRRAAPGDNQAKVDEFVFHMRDWEEDLLRLAAIYRDPDKHTVMECRAAVDGLLYHACGHIMQAARLYGGLLDPFGDAEGKRGS
jgi:hypothetical protein